ncbi:hypothetical protein [Hallella bergensis]|uniref:hypothetical protein n=1 Tax=Hallella bergensis TaxID=242750 RepID=UPI0023F20642|nr:hypothetical protein [Hallella bergensis]
MFKSLNIPYFRACSSAGPMGCALVVNRAVCWRGANVKRMDIGRWAIVWRTPCTWIAAEGE